MLPRSRSGHCPCLPSLRRCVVLSLVVAALEGTAARSAMAQSGTDEPRSIILLVSDGAGTAHWTLAAHHDDEFALARMKTVGLVDTQGSDHVVSGSAPTASAYATGVRTFMGAISVGPDSVPVPTVAEVAMSRGMSTGLLTTTALTDATPAAFAAHVPSRRAMGEIARQMVDNGITVLMGGGRAHFGPSEQPDGGDLIARARQSYTYVETLDQLAHLEPDTVETLLGLFAEGGMGMVAERGEEALHLMASTALSILDRNRDGFFLMVENEESDTQSHGNADEATLVAEMLDFDRIVEMALDYQAEHPETLVLVTGDHETGGLSLPYASTPERPIVISWATSGHTGALLPIFASGPGAERFGGFIRNDEVGRILIDMVRRRTP